MGDTTLFVYLEKGGIPRSYYLNNGDKNIKKTFHFIFPESGFLWGEIYHSPSSSIAWEAEETPRDFKENK